MRGTICDICGKICTGDAIRIKKTELVYPGDVIKKKVDICDGCWKEISKEVSKRVKEV